jgi:zinc protease
VVENHGAPIATALVAVRGGASVQSKGEEGLAHLFEHLIFRSYDNDPGAFDIATVDLAGTNQGGTGIEFVYYYLILPSENTEKGIGLLGRLITRAAITQNDLEAERMVVLDELERSQSDPEEELARKVSHALWGAAWHRRDLSGDSISLTRITQERLAEAYARYYVPNNAALIVTGDVLPGKVFEAAERHFGGWVRRPDPFHAREFDPLEPLTDSQALILSRAVADVTIRIAIQGPSIQDDIAATHAAYALLEVINDPRSEFQQRLVGSGVFQSLEGAYVVLSDVGLITILGKTAAAYAHQALPALLVQMNSPPPPA